MRLANYIYIHNFLSKKECKAIIKEGQKGLHKATVYNEENKSVENSKRKTNISFLRQGSSVDNTLKKVIDGVCGTALKHYGMSITDIEAIQYAEYEVGMFYGWHTDSGSSVKQTWKRDISASLILNDQKEYTGGSLQMVLADNISKNNVVTPQDVENQNQVTLIVFPSSMIHQVTPVLTGIRKSLVLWSFSNATD